MKEILIGKNYKIARSDELNLEVFKFTTVTRKKGRFHEAGESDKWVSLGFYSNVRQACTKILDDVEVEESDVDSLESLIRAYDNASARIVKAVEASGLSRESFEKKEDNRGRAKGVSVKVAKAGDTEETTTRRVGRPAKAKV